MFTSTLLRLAIAFAAVSGVAASPTEPQLNTGSLGVDRVAKIS